MENETNIIAEKTYDEWTVRLMPVEFEKTREKIEKINARAAKKGFTGKLELVYNRIEVKEKNEIGFELTKVFYETRITGTAPSYNGWKFLARIDVLPNSTEFTLAAAPGVENIDRNLVKINTCEHCNTARYRKNIYLVQNEESGEIKNVGSTCIKDFLGWSASFSFVSVGSIYDELFGSDRYYGEPTYTVDSVLAAAYLAIKEWGWVSSKAYEGCPTKLHVRNIFDPPALGKNPSRADYEYRDKLVAAMKAIPEAEEKVPAMRAWINSLDDSSLFNQNLKAAISVDEVSSKQIGILSYVPEGYARHLGKQAEWEIRQQEKANQVNEFIGNVGDKVEVEGVIKSINYFPNGFGGSSTLYTIRTDKGLVKWFASSSVLGEDTEKEVKIKGTVKKHDVWKDTKSTVLTRCKEAK